MTDSRERSSQFPLRFSDDLHQRLKEPAKQNQRPVNAEIIFRIEQTYEPATAIAPALIKLIDKLVEHKVQHRPQAIATTITLKPTGD